MMHQLKNNTPVFTCTQICERNALCLVSPHTHLFVQGAHLPDYPTFHTPWIWIKHQNQVCVTCISYGALSDHLSLRNTTSIHIEVWEVARLVVFLSPVFLCTCPSTVPAGSRLLAPLAVLPTTLVLDAHGRVGGQQAVTHPLVDQAGVSRHHTQQHWAAAAQY